jgi:hypothetical protein
MSGVSQNGILKDFYGPGVKDQNNNQNAMLMAIKRKRKGK